MALHWVLDGADLQQIIRKRMSQRTLVLQRERGAVWKRRLQDAGDSEPPSNLLGRLEIQGGGEDDPAALSTVACQHLQGWGSAMKQVRVSPQSRGSGIS